MFNLATEPAFNKFFHPDPPALKFHSLCLVMQCYHCPVDSLGADDQATMAERSFRLQVTILAEGGRERKTHGAQLWNYLHNCKVKAVLRGGQQRALCLGSAFWPRRNTICCHGPPILPLGPITTAGQGGQSAAPLPRPTVPLTIVAVGFFHLHAEDEKEQN